MKTALLYIFMLLFIVTINAQDKPKSCENKMKCEKKTNCDNASCENKKNTVGKIQNEKGGNSNVVAVVNKVCPVSGEELDNNNLVTYKYKDKTYGLCCKKCLSKISANPEKYLAKLDKEALKTK